MLTTRMTRPDRHLQSANSRLCLGAVRGRGQRLSRELSRGMSRGRRLGLSLFGSLLALGLLGAMVLAVALFLENRMLDERARLAARQLTVLSDAAASHVSGRFPAMLAALGGGSAELTLATLRTSGVLPAGFADVGAMGRGYRVLMLAAGTDTIDLLVTQTVSAGDTAVPASALFEAGGSARMGAVLPDTPQRLTGPAVDADLRSFQAAFAGAPQAGALATLRRLDHRAVYGDQLYRVSVPGFADANRMETDLDLGGNDLTGANAVEADTLSLESDLTVGGELTVIADLMVGRALTVAGPAEGTAGGAGRRAGGLDRCAGGGGGRERLAHQPAERQRDGADGDGDGGLRRRRHGTGGAGHRTCGRHGGRLQPPHRRTLHGVLRRRSDEDGTLPSADRRSPGGVPLGRGRHGAGRDDACCRKPGEPAECTCRHRPTRHGGTPR